MKRLLPLSFLLIVFCTCAPSPEAPHGIYYWQTRWIMTPEAVTELENLGVGRLFLRLFDLDLIDGAPRPRGPLQLPDTTVFTGNLEIVPVVFITNAVFLADTDPEALAVRLTAALSMRAARLPALRTARELQIDCDWTPRSRDRYFAFLTALARELPGRALSVTVRLHQYREREANGIPPVDYGLLMCYNLAPVQELTTRNAILDLDLLAGYLRAPRYPLPLEAALPTFRWGAAFRGDRFLGITNAVAPDERLRPFPNGLLLAQRDTTVGSLLLRAGDAVRPDGPTGDDLLLAVRLLRLRPEVRTVHFYDWRPGVTDRFGVAEVLEEWGR